MAESFGATSYTVRDPLTTVLIDMNGDGFLDIVTENVANNSVSILLNKQDGNFADAQLSPTGISPYAVAVGDINGDGFKDIVTANNDYTINTLSILKGKADGSFETPTHLTIGGVVGQITPWYVVLADVNQDNRLDIITTNLTSDIQATADTVSVLLNNGSGGFQTPQLNEVGLTPFGITTGDFNNDKKIDIVTASLSNNNISILLGNGNGTFATQIVPNPTVGNSPYSIISGDLNHDGNLDIVTANNSNNSVSILFGQGNGSFSTPTTMSVGNGPQSVTLADMDNNGGLDIIVVSNDSLQQKSQISILANDGSGHFVAGANLTNANNPRFISVGDLNNDGKQDIVTVESNSIVVRLNIQNSPPSGTPTAKLIDGKEDQSYIVEDKDLLQGFTDADSDKLSVTNLTAVYNNSTESLVNNQDGSWGLIPTTNYNGSVTLNYNVTDNKSNPISASLTFNLAAVNDPPTGKSTLVLANGTEDITYNLKVVDLIKGFSDPENDALTVTDLVADQGTTVNKLNGIWDFIPKPNYNGAVKLTYNVNDGQGGLVAATLPLTVTAVADAPIGKPTAILAAATEDKSYTLKLSDLLQGFSDPDNDPLSLTGVTITHGALVDNNDGSWQFTPEASYNGSAVISYTVTDSKDGTIAATQTLMVNPANDAPVGKATFVLPAGIEDTAYTLKNTDLLQGFSDIDADPLTVTNIVPSNGTVIANNDATWTLIPATNYNGSITFTYSVVDGKGGAISATQNVLFSPTNDAPQGKATASLPGGLEDQTYILKQTDLLQGFTDLENDPLTVSQLTVDSGTVVNNFDGSWTFTPEANYSGTVAVNYQVSDGNGGLTAASQSFKLVSTNHPPLGSAAANLADGTEDVVYVIQAKDLLTGFTDDDQDPLIVENLTADQGILEDNLDGSWNLTLAANQSAQVNLNYDVSDGVASIAATQTVNIVAVNDLPLQNTAIALSPAIEDTPYLFKPATLLSGIGDADNDPLTVTDLTVSSGTVTAGNNGGWRFVPDANFNGNVRVSYTVSDGHEGSLILKKVLTVTAVNDLPGGGPTATLANAIEDRAYTLRAKTLLQGFSDADRDPLTISDLIVNRGSLTPSSNGNWSYTPDPNDNGLVTLTYNVNDTHNGQIAATQTFSLTAVNDLPTGIVVIDNNSDPARGAATVWQGDILSISNNLEDAEGIGSLSYQWLADGKPIAGAITELYLVTANEVGKKISAAVSYVDNQGTREQVSGSVTGVVTHTVLGTEQADSLVGSTATDVLLGLAGNDSLYGNGGEDLLNGGSGYDTVSYQNLTAGVKVDLNLNRAQNTIGAGVNTLIEIENLIGSSLNDKLIGNSLANVLSGGLGKDTLQGGLGDDTYITNNVNTKVVELANQGIDTVSTTMNWTLGKNLENLVLTSTTAISATGNTLNNIIVGNEANNVLNGGIGKDQLLGGLGDDVYLVDQSTDQIIERADAGKDQVVSALSWKLGANLENLTLSGTNPLKASGNNLPNRLVGNQAANILEGGLGNDVLIGRAGDDTYWVNDAKDKIIENSQQGIDSVSASISWNLADHLENLILTGKTAQKAVGNTLNNQLLGNTLGNVLDGGVGDDTLKGGLGNDTYLVDSSNDVVFERTKAGIDGVQSSVSWSLAAAVENLTLTGRLAINATGNNANNGLIGNLAANVLDGGAGRDTLKGGLGNDTYHVDNSADKIIELTQAGNDTVISSVNWTLGAELENLTLTGKALNAVGNKLNNLLIGNSLNNVLDGGSGDDKLSGGLGDDTYFVSSSADKVIEASHAGSDTVLSAVSWTLVSNVEKLSLIDNNKPIRAIGNELANILSGNDAANLLDGGLANDTLIGGMGNDTYVVDSKLDKVIEKGNSGVDTIQTSVNWTLATNLENVTLLENKTALTAMGNVQNNVLSGNHFANVLNGAAGKDTLIGGSGNDTYLVDNSQDRIIENGSRDQDVVQTTVNWTLGNKLENLTLVGKAALNATGNVLDNQLVGNQANNVLSGNAGDDILEGLAGNDVLMGGSGSDIFRLSSLTGFDKITDFTLQQDRIQLENSVFTAFSKTGTVKADNFVSGTVAVDANDFLIYDSGKGYLYYDADGNGTASAVKIAILGTDLNLTTNDFVII